MLLFLPLFTVSLGYGAVLPILPQLLDRLHASATDERLLLHAGLLTGVYIGAFVVAAPLWGRVTDRRGPRTVLIAGLLGYAVATVGFAFAASLGSAYAARFFAGAFAAGLLPATAGFIVARCRDAARSRHLGWLNAASIAGFLVGPALTGAAHRFMTESSWGRSSVWIDTAVPIWITGALALLCAGGVAWGLPLESGCDPSADVVPRPALRPAALARHPIFVLSALGAFGLGAFEVGLSMQSLRTWQWSPGALAGLFTVCSLTMLAIQFALFDRLQRHVRPERLVVAGFVAMAVGLAFLATTSVYGVVLGLVTLVASGSGVLLPTLSVAMADQAGARAGSAFGYQNAASNFGQAAGSAVIGILFSALPVASFGIIGLTMLGAAAAAWRIARLRGGLNLAPRSASGS